MLARLSISNIALIDKLDIEFESGFSALTGETGAGKSILIESVSFVLGDRASRELIRTGEQKAVVEAEFLVAPDSPVALYANERELECVDGELILYRELSQSGRNVCRVNGVMISAAELKNIGALLCDLHGQHAHQSLLDPKTHINLVDAYAGNAALRGLLAEALSEAQEAGREYAELIRGLKDRERRLDLIRYQLNEIDSAQLSSGEEEEARQNRERMRNAQQIMDSLGAAHDALYGESAALNAVFTAQRSLEAISSYDKEYEKQARTLDEAYFAIEDVALSLRDALANFSCEPDELQRIEDRLSLITSLKKKYGGSIDEILAYRDKIFVEAEALNNAEERSAELLAKKEAALGRFAKLCAELSSSRKAAAVELETQVTKQLRDMDIPKAEFRVGFTVIPPEELSPNGGDGIEFLFSANVGEPLKPLSRVASGGEVSRVMLAFKVALAESDSIDALIFDEIDTGISGHTAVSVAHKMRELSRRHQVLCVTHLAPIAALADSQYLVKKRSTGDKTFSDTLRLTQEQRPAELARIMGSTSNDPDALAYAERLLKGRE